jgi:ribosomal protein S18 acetylase RimI-like enzyme
MLPKRYPDLGSPTSRDVDACLSDHGSGADAGWYKRRVQPPRDHLVRRGELADAPAIGRLLHDFNTEYDEPTPGPQALAERVAQLLADGQTIVLLGGAGPDGIAVLRLRPAIWTPGLECYLAELYVAPDRRGQGLGRALMEAAIDHARLEGADHMDLGTGEDDVAARALYESLGFTNREGRPDGPVNYFYEREL